MSAQLLDNPNMPSDEQLFEWFYAQSDANNGIKGLHAIWRAGVDAGMMHTLINARVETTQMGYGKIELPTQEQIVKRFGSLSSFALARLIQIAQNMIDERFKDGVVD